MKPTEKKSSVFLVVGDDDYMVDREARSIVDGLCPPSDQAFGLELIDGAVDLVEEAVSALTRCLDAISTVGLLGGSKVVWLRRAAFLADNVLGRSSDVRTHLDRLTEWVKKGLPPGQVLVVSSAKVDGRSAFSKACKKAADVREFKMPEKVHEADQSAGDRVRECWKELDLTPENSDVLQSFVEMVGVDTRSLRQESEKLSAYLGPARRQVTRGALAAVVSPARESIAWDLADHVGLRDIPAAIRVLRQLLYQRESAIGLIFGLEGRVRDLLILRECLRRRWLRMEGSFRYRKAVWSTDSDLDERLGRMSRDPRKMHPYRTVRLVEQAEQYTLRELLAAQQLLTETHAQLVSSSIPPGLLLEYCIVRIAAKPSAV